MSKVRIGYIGVGNIFPMYLKTSRKFHILDVVACADSNHAYALNRAQEFGIEARTLDQLLQSDDIDIIVNLTPPQAHAEIDLRIIQAGKHVYAEKPLALTTQDGKTVLEAAAQAGVRVGSAPDTILGGGIQTCRKLLDEGWIGTPIAATAFMASRGPESWHPNPAFFYQKGGGPLYDMGPYYISTLVYLLGAIKRVTASTRITSPTRIATSEARFGEVLNVEVSTHSAGLLEFASGVIATTTISFDVWQHHLPRIEIYGTLGTLVVPDPNTFGGVVQMWLHAEREWRDIPLAFSADVQRSVGVADMAEAIMRGEAHRCNGELAYHVLETMEAFDRSSHSGTHITLESQPQRPDALPLGLLAGDVRLR